MLIQILAGGLGISLIFLVGAGLLIKHLHQKNQVLNKRLMAFEAMFNNSLIRKEVQKNVQVLTDAELGSALEEFYRNE